jgi:hypothetical protein
MTLDTNDSIRYLMNEMDPSEAIQYERELEQNPDLRIDIESMRRAADHLHQVPLFSAPQAVLNEALSFASQKAQHRKRIQLRKRTLQAAAVLTLAIVPALYFSSTESETLSDPGSLVQSTPSSPWVDQNESIRLAVTGVGGNTSSSSSQTGLAQTSSVQQTRTASPTFFLTLESENGNRQTAGVLDSIYQESFRKLRPIQQEVQLPTTPRDLQLTGSSRN